MKTIIAIFTLCLAVGFSYGQTEKESIKLIRSHFTWINNQTDYNTEELNNIEFLNFSPDNGALLKGFYKKDNLYKIVETVGLSYALITTEYYLWDNQLFFVYHTEKEYKEIYDSKGNFINMDYTSTDLKYESRHYFVNNKEIRKIVNGDSLTGSETPDYLSNSQDLRAMLDNKKNFQAEYDKIRGRWVAKDDALSIIEFDGLTKVDYYSDEFMDQFKIKIEGNYLYCTYLDGSDDIDKYEIIDLSKKKLTLLYLPAGRILKYKRTKLKD